MKNPILSCFLLIMILNEAMSKLKPSKVQIAINCGGESIKTPSGIKYIADKYYSGGEQSSFGTGTELRYSDDKEVYFTERWSKDDFSYKVPIKGEGQFILILQFSEVYFTSKNEKVFDVELNGFNIIKDLDIFDKVGKGAAYDEYIKLEIKNGKLKVKGENVSFDGKNLEIKLKKKEKDNPKINGIVLIKGTLEDTNYSEYIEMVENEEKKKQDKERKQRDFQRMSKSIDYEDFEDDFVDDGRFNVGGNGVFSLKGLGIILVILLLAYFFIIK